ncbi:MAG: preprotein translocase subunit SecA [Patescibacteria group bacterium]|nr:preprotein translocase subunit SecA [Patescibacteria group bacterium]
MFNFFKRFFDYNQKQIEKFKKKVEEINKLEDKARILKDEDFKKETQKLKDKIAGDEKKLDENLSWAYALAREASRRTLGQRHFDVQLMASIALHEGKIAEQKTGEGKTLSAVPALYLNALLGRGVHLVTVNDYLARRDAGWMGKIFYFLGLTTSSIISDKSFIYDPNYKNNETDDWRLVHLRPIVRKEAYQTDITYGINSEFGFDYLRDNMAQNINDLVQRDFYYAIIDEADSVLIDEARTPHIISVPYEEDISKYYQYSKIVELLNEKNDYKIDEKLRTANFTEKGIEKIEKILGVKNLYEKDYDTLYHLEAALKAKTLFKKDKDYIVKDDEVIIVDEFTGRLLYGRRFSEGLHQAIEAKEKVSIKQESKTLATVSLQNYFRMYKKLAGMTGTAATEAEEFNKIYKTDVVVIPTHRPMIRKDRPDMIYKTKKGKYEAVVDEIVKNYKIGRPVLVGTTSIENNEYLSFLLKKRGVPHEVLNAKNHEKEALIIAKAGEKGSVTVATNMAGRGGDIILGGDIKDEKEIKKWQKKHDEVVALGGLLVIGTERHESRRIDNQLRGRSGRQGDPGESVFYVSLEDDLMRIFGGEQITRLMNFLNFPEDQPLSHPMVSKAIEQAQIKVEGFNFDIRKHLVDYDDVLNKQREIVYSLRRKILFGFENKDFYEIIFKMIDEEIKNIFNFYSINDELLKKENLKKLKEELNMIVDFSEKEIISPNFFEISREKIEKEFKKREKKFGKEIWQEIIKIIVLSTIDKYWMDHLTAIENLREGINLRGYAQLDPLVEYKNEAFSMFERLIYQINSDISRRLFKVEVNINTDNFSEKKDEQKMIFQSASSVNPFQKNQLDETEKNKIKTQTIKKHKLGRNDLCWCGSGKKYKKCHYPN